MSKKLKGLLIVAGACCVAAGGMFATRGARVEDTASVVAATENAPAWGDDLRAAFTDARATGRDVLVAFCAPAEGGAAPGPATLERADFRRDAGRSFVLVRLAPSDATSPTRLTQISTSAERLGVSAFPTYVLLDADGKPYARSQVTATASAEYLNEFNRLRQAHVRRDEAVAAAGKATGAERARHLGEALAAVGPFADTEYGNLVRQLIEADPDNATGLRARYEPAAVARQADLAIQNEVYPLIDRGSYAEAIARIDRVIDDLKPARPQLQLLLAFKGQLYFTMGDRDRAVQALDRAIAVDPQSESAGRARAARAQVLPGA